jgi:hypothetical protein
LDKATIAKIEADRIYDLILPETDGKETVTVPLSYLESVLATGHKLEGLAPAYISRALEKLSGTAKIHRFRRKAVIPKESLAFVAAAFSRHRVQPMGPDQDRVTKSARPKVRRTKSASSKTGRTQTETVEMVGTPTPPS